MMKKIWLSLVMIVGAVGLISAPVYAERNFAVSCKLIDGGRTAHVSIPNFTSRTWEIVGEGCNNAISNAMSDAGIKYVNESAKTISATDAEKLAGFLDAKKANAEEEWKNNNGGDDANRGNLPTGEYKGQCTSILPPSWCESAEGEGIIKLLRTVLEILTAGVGILATIGLVISGIQYIMARDDSGKVAKVKSRIFNIVIGVLAYGVMWIVLEWLIPGGVL